MGKRKSATVRRAKPKEKLATTFDCPFCGKNKSIEVKIERRRCLGSLSCRVCQVEYSVQVTKLTEPIDVFSEWIDRCEEENDANNNGSGRLAGAGEDSAAIPADDPSPRGDEYDDDDDEAAAAAAAVEPQHQVKRGRLYQLDSDSAEAAATAAALSPSPSPVDDEEDQEDEEDWLNEDEDAAPDFDEDEAPQEEDDRPTAAGIAAAPSYGETLPATQGDDQIEEEGAEEGEDYDDELEEVDEEEAEEDDAKAPA